MKNDTNSLAHTTWECKYHIVFAPKFRRKEVEIIEVEACKEHIHILVSIPPKFKRIKFCRIFKRKNNINNI